MKDSLTTASRLASGVICFDTSQLPGSKGTRQKSLGGDSWTCAHHVDRHRHRPFCADRYLRAVLLEEIVRNLVEAQEICWYKGKRKARGGENLSWSPRTLLTRRASSGRRDQPAWVSPSQGSSGLWLLRWATEEYLAHIFSDVLKIVFIYVWFNIITVGKISILNLKISWIFYLARWIVFARYVSLKEHRPGTERGEGPDIFSYLARDLDLNSYDVTFAFSVGNVPGRRSLASTRKQVRGQTCG